MMATAAAALLTQPRDVAYPEGVPELPESDWDALHFFDSDGMSWTPEWDDRYGMGRTVKAVVMPGGRLHRFPSLVSAGEALEYRRKNLPVQIGEDPPRRLTNVVTHKDYHPSYMRVGVKVNGEDRNDIHWYDQDAGVYATNARLQPVLSGFIETYWRYPETRQQRRARERWEQSR